MTTAGTDRLPTLLVPGTGAATTDRPAGLTAVLRVHNESRWIPHSLPPMLRSTSAVVLVDNRSTDGTAELATEVAESLGLADRLTVVEYPHVLSRCGAEHLGTPAESPQSLVEFNNWALRQVRTRHALKWDGDMVLTREGEALISALSWQLDDSAVSVRLRHHPVYVQDDRVAYVDLGVRNVETYGHPVLSRLHLRQGLRVGDPRPPAGEPPLRPAGRHLHRAEAPRRGRVLALDRPRVLRDVAAHQPQAA